MNMQPESPLHALQRRRILAGLTALGAGALLPGCQTAATGTPGKLHRIDVHHHFVPDAYITAMKANKIRPVDWSVQMSLEEMDKSGIATGMISPPPPGVTFGDVAFRRKLARDINEAGTKMVSERPARFRLLATLPFASVEDSLAEIAYAFDTLKADGISLMTSYNGKYLGDPSDPRRTEPPQGRGLHASHHADVLRQPATFRLHQRHRRPSRHHAHHGEPDVPGRRGKIP